MPRISEAMTLPETTTNGVQNDDVAPIDATAPYSRHPLAYELSKQPFLTPRRIKVIVAGAGASGLSLAHEVEIGTVQNVDLQILEKNQGLGGTWFENRYPGQASTPYNLSFRCG
jgi:hypothetical protein